MKNIKLKITSFNEKIINFFNKISSFNKFKRSKLIKISRFNKILIFLIALLFIYLFYLSVPALYNKESLQKDLTEKLSNDFNVNISLSSDIKYLILPAPHILIKDVKIFYDNKKNPKELSQIKKLKIFISQKSLLNKKYLKITKFIIQDANFLIQKNDFKYLNNFINKKFSKKKIIIKNSNIFFRDKTNETISIFNINNMQLFYDENKSENLIISNGKLFKVPFNIKWNKKFDSNNESEFFMELKKLLMNIKNISIKTDSKINSGKNILSIGNSKLVTDYKIEKNFILLKSKDSKLINNRIEYDGEIHSDPFYVNLNIFLEKINIDKFIIKNNILKELLYSKVLFNKNLSANIFLNIKNVVKNKLFDSGKFSLKFDNGFINLNNSYFISRKIGKLNIYKSSLKFIDDKLIFKSAFDFQIKDQKEFYKSFQTPKRNRKKLKNIYFDIEYNILENNLNIVNFVINDLNKEPSESVKSLLEQYSNNKDNKIENWIDLKIFHNKILENYDG